jgi:O-antigen/teichoic acid export membrane protein
MTKPILKIKEINNKLFSTGFFHVFEGNVINKIIGFLCSIILVRILSKNEYGIFSYAWNIYSIVFLFSGLGVESGMLQLLSENGKDTVYVKKISKFATRFGIVFNLGLSIVLIIIGLFAPLKIEGSGKLICFLCFLPVVNFLLNNIYCYFRSLKKNKEYAKLSVINTLLYFIFTVGFVFLFREIGLVLGNYFSMTISCFIGIVIFKAYLLGSDNNINNNFVKDLLRIGFISMLINALSQLLYLLDVFIIGIIDPNETIIASYKVATMIPSALAFIPQSLVIYIYPYFAEHKNDSNWCLKRYKQVILGIGIFNFLLSTILFFFAPIVIKAIFGSQYIDSLIVFRILIINYFISGTFRIISGNLLVTQRKLIFNFFESVLSSLLNIVADYYFIQIWGSMGAAIATLLVVVFSSTLSSVYLIYTFKNIKN